MKNFLKNKALALFAVAVLVSLGCDNYEQEIAAIEKEFAGYGLSERWQKSYGANNSKFVYHYRRGDVEANKQLVIPNQKHFIYSFFGQMNHALILRLENKKSTADSLLINVRDLAIFFQDHLDDPFLIHEYSFCEKLDSSGIEMRRRVRAERRNSETLEAFQTVLEMARKNHDRKQEVEILRKIQINLHDQSKYQEALIFGKEGLNLADSINYRLEKAYILRRMGNTSINLNLYDIALTHFEQGMVVAKNLREKSEEMRLHDRIGIVFTYKDLRPNALESFNQGIAIADSLQHSYINQLYNDRALNLMWMGFYDRSLADFRSAYESTDNIRKQGNALSNMGWLYSLIGNANAADSNLNQAHELIRNLENMDDRANILHNLGVHYLRIDSLGMASQFFLQAIEVIRKNVQTGGDSLNSLSAEIRLSEGDTYLRNAENWLRKSSRLSAVQKYLQIALEKYSDAESLLSGIITADQQDRISVSRGKAYLFGGQYNKALAELRRVISRRSQLASADPLIVLDAQYILSEVYQRQGKKEAAENALRETIKIVDAGADNVKDENRLAFYDKRQHIYDKLILHLFNDSRFEDAFMSVEGSRARSLIDNIKAKELFGAAEDTLSDVAAIINSLGDRIQLVEYKVTESYLLIFFFTGDSFNTPLKIPVSRDTLSQFVLDFRKAIGADENKAFEDKIKIDPEAQFERGAKAGARLYECLIAPVAEWLDPEKVLYVVPDEMLCYVPFDGLQNSPRGGRFLVEDYTIAYSPSAIVLKYVLNHSQSEISPENDTFFGIANPTFDLPETETELKNSAKYFSQENVNTPEPYEVNEDTVRAALAGKPAVVQFSTHANTRSGNSRYHSIVVGRQAQNSSGAMRNLNGNSTANKKSFDDDLLMVYEIQQMDLNGVKFVNLPGCNTGGGLMYRGEGVVGITSAFMKAGVPSVMSTLWKIYDRESQQLVSDFFAYWMTSTGVSRAEALQKAKQKMIQEYRNKQQYPFPHRWAAFIINGDSD